MNRIDDIIMFNPLNKDNALEIANLELNELMKRMMANGYELTLTDETKRFIVDKGFDAQYGARSLKRAIQRHIEDALCVITLWNILSINNCKRRCAMIRFALKANN